IHCTEGYLNAEKIAAEKIPAVVGPLICTRTKPELSNERDENPAALKKAGVEVAICTDHPEVPIQYLALSAGIAVRAGMDHDDAIKAITSVPAKILGLAGKIGSAVPGADADLAVFRGDPLSVYETPAWVIAGGKIVKRP
ncbi:MAG: amidohydrolase family protein, partial [Oscillospiraceae bacterium]|nr:amidohydrolase family protein [Oscillospiraceae bacterium]